MFDKQISRKELTQLLLLKPWATNEQIFKELEYVINSRD